LHLRPSGISYEDVESDTAGADSDDLHSGSFVDGSGNQASAYESNASLSNNSLFSFHPLIPAHHFMKVSGFNEAVALAVAKNDKYRPEGYQFLRESLEATLKKRSKSKQQHTSSHVSAEELLEGFRRMALREFGPMAPTVLHYWGVGSCRDIGEMVFSLVEVGAFGRTENDRIDDFESGFDFHEAFVVPFLPPPVPATDSASVNQRTLFTK